MDIMTSNHIINCGNEFDINEDIDKPIELDDDESPKELNQNDEDTQSSISDYCEPMACCETPIIEEAPRPEPSTATIKLPSATYEEPYFRFGPYIPLVRKDNGIFVEPSGIVDCFVEIDQNPLSKQLTLELLPEDSILETPSLVTPLLVKKRTKWPNRLESDESNSQPVVGHDQPDEAIVCNRTLPDSSGSVQVVTVLFNQPSTPENKKNELRSSDYMKSATVSCLTNNTLNRSKSVLSIQDFHKSSVSDMLVSLGLSRVMETKLESDLRKCARRIKRSQGECTGMIEELESLREQLTMTRNFNEPFKSKDLYKCPHCPFKSDSMFVLNSHLEVPHTRKRELICNWCDYRTKDFSSLAFHCVVTHRKRCRMEKPLTSMNCDFCSFGTSSKKKMLLHLDKCQHTYRENSFLEPMQFELDEPPTVTSKPITREDVLIYEQTLKDLRLSVFSPHQFRVPGAQQSSLRTLLVLPKTNVPPRFNLNQTVPLRHPFAITHNEHPFIRPFGQVSPHVPHNSACHQVGLVQYPKNQNMTHLLNSKSLANSNVEVTTGPTCDKTRVTMSNRSSRQVSPESEDSDGSNTKESIFVICEICDGYITDLAQLKAHMQLIHKVKIHHKMLEARPPVACQKCQWRFFTDQGLERHLLGAHGLVTTNMQDLADQGLDAGRCTNCGRAFASKIVTHMKETHKVTLKSAHLSYKCTVCSATFSLYRLFENHVYSVHNDAVRRK